MRNHIIPYLTTVGAPENLSACSLVVCGPQHLPPWELYIFFNGYGILLYCKTSQAMQNKQITFDTLYSTAHALAMIHVPVCQHRILIIGHVTALPSYFI